jgi:hypothetical protein
METAALSFAEQRRWPHPERRRECRAGEEGGQTRADPGHLIMCHAPAVHSSSFVIGWISHAVARSRFVVAFFAV